MSKCIVCEKELPEGAKIPVCEYHRAQAKEKGAVVVGFLGTGALFVKTVAPKVVPIIKEKGPEVAKATINAVKAFIRRQDPLLEPTRTYSNLLEPSRFE